MLTILLLAYKNSIHCVVLDHYYEYDKSVKIERHTPTYSRKLHIM